MDKKEAWKKFKETGKIEYYLKYKEKEETDSVYEDMLEIEDWIKPNTTTGDYNYDEHLLTANKIILNSSLPVELTKDSKYFRGYTLINKK